MATPSRGNPLLLRLGERRALLLIGDFLLALLALLVALYFWASNDRWMGFSIQFLERRAPEWFYLLPVIWLLLMIELYDVHRAGNAGETAKAIAYSTLAGLGIYLLFYFVISPMVALPRRGVTAFFVAAPVLTFLWRMLYIRIFTAPQFMRRVLLVGGGKTGQTLLQEINNLNPRPFYIAGVIDDDPQKQGGEVEGHPVLGGGNSLMELIEARDISDVIVAISGEMTGELFQALLDAQERGVTVTRMPKSYEELVNRVPIRCLQADWIIRSFVDEARIGGFYEFTKRLIDILGGLVGVLLFLAVLPFVAAAILLESGRPIFYSQTRSGRGGQPYQIFKFRTMVQNAEADGKPRWAKEDDERATRIGRFLRKTHIDELPQFLNVLRGDMSLVGPRSERPELVSMFQKHVPFYRARLLVKPGITGWAQVNYGYAATIDETITKLEYDLYYIKHRSLVMDVMILLRTPATMLGFRGR